ncbi:MAG: pilus assembly protein PilM [Candidatus Margulisbacteria bacterium]|nr:pilus assembly protein PilM [Candidatus Margulisiibacteriota bacterium]
MKHKPFKSNKTPTDFFERFNGSSKHYWYTFHGLKYDAAENGVALFGTGENLGFGVDTKKGLNGAPFIVGKNNCLEFDITGTANGDIKLELTDFNDNIEILSFSINATLPHQKLLLNKVKDKLSKIQFVFSANEVDVKISNLFFSKSERVINRIFIPTLAFDIGHTSIKMALVDNHQNPLLLDYQEIPELESEENRKAEITRLIRGMIFKHKLKANQLIFVISDTAIAHRRLILPPEEKREDWIQFFQKELSNLIPFPSENNFITYYRNDPEISDFFISATPQTILLAYRDLLKRLGFSCKYALANTLALYNIYKTFFALKGQNTAIIDIGATKTLLAIVNPQKILFARYIKVGGEYFTQHLADSLAIPFSKAEKIKKENPPEQSPAAEALAEIKEIWVTDLKRTLEYFKNENPALNIEQICLCGGGSLLPGLTNFIKEKTGIPVSDFLNTNSILKAKFNSPALHTDLQAALFMPVLGLALEKSGEKATYNLFKGQPIPRKKTPTKQFVSSSTKYKKSFYDWWFFKLEKKIQLTIGGSILILLLIILPALVLLATNLNKNNISRKQIVLSKIEESAVSANIIIQDIRQSESLINSIKNNRHNKFLLKLFGNLNPVPDLSFTNININSQNKSISLQGLTKEEWKINQFVSKLQSSKLFKKIELLYVKKQNNLLAFTIQGTLLEDF